jgi:hypothetical protein
MPSWEDVRRIALALPETTERPSYDGLPAWRVRDKPFVWERPLRRADLDALGDAAPDGPLLGVRVADLGVKEALLADDPAVYLVRLDRISLSELTEVVTEAWYSRAPKRLAAAHRADQEPTNA